MKYKLTKLLCVSKCSASLQGLLNADLQFSQGQKCFFGESAIVPRVLELLLHLMETHYFDADESKNEIQSKIPNSILHHSLSSLNTHTSCFVGIVQRYFVAQSQSKLSSSYQASPASCQVKREIEQNENRSTYTHLDLIFLYSNFIHGVRFAHALNIWRDIKKFFSAGRLVLPDFSLVWRKMTSVAHHTSQVNFTITFSKICDRYCIGIISHYKNFIPRLFRNGRKYFLVKPLRITPVRLLL